MVPHQPDDVSGTVAHAPKRSAVTEQLMNGTEQEYHTESDASDSADEQLEPAVDEDRDLESDTDGLLLDPPLLPTEVLKSLPNPAYSTQTPNSTAWKPTNRKDRMTERHRSRQRKRREWDKLRRAAEGAGVLEAGKAAQIKRGIVQPKNKIKSGRVQKKTRPTTSGRQQLLEQRRRAVQHVGGVSKKPKR